MIFLKQNSLMRQDYQCITDCETLGTCITSLNVILLLWTAEIPLELRQRQSQ